MDKSQACAPWTRVGVEDPAAVRAAGETVHRTNQQARLSTHPDHEEAHQGPRERPKPHGPCPCGTRKHPDDQGDRRRREQATRRVRPPRPIDPPPREPGKGRRHPAGRAQPPGHDRERTRPEPELGMCPITPQVGCQRPRQPQHPRHQDRRDHQETASQPAQTLPIPEENSTAGPRDDWMIANRRSRIGQGLRIGRTILVGRRTLTRAILSTGQ